MGTRPRRRWRIRSLMIAVAIVAGACWLVREVMSGEVLSLAAFLAISVLVPIVLVIGVLALMGFCAALGSLGIMLATAFGRCVRGRKRGH